MDKNNSASTCLQSSRLTKNFFHNPFFHIFLILLLGLLAYSNTFHVPFHFDDESNIVENVTIKDLNFYIEPLKAEVFKGITEYPMLKQRYIGSLTFALNYRIHGLDVTGYHIVNLLIHIINALLVYFLVLLTFRTPFLRTQNTEVRIQNDTVHSSRFTIHSSQFIALFAALLFVSHPLQTQAVTYIVQRLASLATLFYLLSLVMYIKARLGSQNTEHRQKTINPKSVICYLTSVVCAVLAMKTKEIAFTLPIVIALYEFLFFDGKVKRRLLYLLPLLLTMLIIPLTLIGVDKPIGDLIGDMSEATKIQTSISRWDYLFTEFRVIVTYIRLLFLPINQNLDYDYPLYHSFFNPEVFLSFLFLLFIFGFGVYLFFRSRTSDGLLRLTAFGVFWFFIALSVESSFIPIKDVIFEHRMYLPSVGALLALSSGAFLGFNRFENKKIQTAGIAFLVSLLVVFSASTYARNTVWKGEISLWEDVVRKSPQKARGHNYLGMAYYSKNLTNTAMEHFQIALRLNPDFEPAHNNLGNVYKSKGLFDKAIKHYKIALRLKPDFIDAHYNLGSLYGQEGLMEKAIEHLQTVLRLNPDLSMAHNNLGNVYKSKGLFDKAIKHYKIALRFKPDFVDAHYNLGSLYGQEGLMEKAMEHLQTAIRLNPDISMAHNSLGNVYYLSGKVDQAIIHFRTAIELQPDNLQAHYNLGLAYQKIGLMDKAQEHFRITESLKKQKR